MLPPLRKYPRTRHLDGSEPQPGDEDLEILPFEAIRGRPLVVEEKLDGANVAIRFDEEGRLLLQSRGHYLTGGPRERHFEHLKSWAHRLRDALWASLAQRYVLYGEWLYAKHAVFYDLLPAYSLEFDMLDLETDQFLSTERRRAILDSSGAGIASVPVLGSGRVDSLADLASLIRRSRYQGPTWRDRLREVAAERRVDVERIVRETDASDLAEGLYVKVEEDGIVKERCKYVRATFRTGLREADERWLRRPIVPNQLQPGVDGFGQPGTAGGAP